MHGREAVSLRWLLLYVWAMGHAVLRHGRTAVILHGMATPALLVIASASTVESVGQR